MSKFPAADAFKDFNSRIIAARGGVAVAVPA